MSAGDRRAAVSRLADAKTGDGVLVIGTTPFIGDGSSIIWCSDSSAPNDEKLLE
jgi:hypothetical protein